ncbi:hypothetical protein [Aeromonas diversa]|uniref:hypothetical protein n=1 Tax=Aeromonas diversa TaxID=502790 RepID=UPI003462EC1C
MQIAPRIQAAEWQKLKLDDHTSPDWITAVQILESRIHERYIEPIDRLITSEETLSASEHRFGFTVLAVDCLLIETLGAFLDGLEDTEGKSKTTFCRFLTTRPFLKGDFTEDLAQRFYKEFRCGILHQAEIGGKSKVWSVGPLIKDHGDNLIVNRNELHSKLKNEFQNYLAELRDPTNVDLRAKFRTKMDHISRSSNPKARRSRT